MALKRAYADRFITRQPDGFYAIWPHGRFGRAYRADYLQRDAFTRTQRRYLVRSWTVLGILLAINALAGETLGLPALAKLGVGAVPILLVHLSYRVDIRRLFKDAETVSLPYERKPISQRAHLEQVHDQLGIGGMVVLLIVCLIFSLGLLFVVVASLRTNQPLPQWDVIALGCAFGAAAVWLAYAIYRLWRNPIADE